MPYLLLVIAFKYPAGGRAGYFVIASVIKARSWGERAIPNTESMTFATVATPSMGTVPTVGFKCYTDARDAGATIDPLVSTSMGKIAKPAGTSTAEPEAEPPGVLGIASIKRFDGASIKIGTLH